MGAQPLDVVLTTRPLLRQLRSRALLGAFLSVLCVERTAAWVSTSPEGDITIRGDAEVRQPRTEHSSCPTLVLAAWLPRSRATHTELVSSSI